MGQRKSLYTENEKKVSRRNPWGSQSYAEIITQAIESSSEKRMTLSQIYEYIIRNVPYFHDKGDSKSSSGWKNSIRHNLSLHNRFQRIQTDEAETTNRCSYWQINPVAEFQSTLKRSSRSRRRKRTRIRQSMIYNSGQFQTNRVSFHNLPFIKRNNFFSIQEKLVNTSWNSSVSMITSSTDLKMNGEILSEFDLRNERNLSMKDLHYYSNSLTWLDSHLKDEGIAILTNTNSTHQFNISGSNDYKHQLKSNTDIFSGNHCPTENQHKEYASAENETNVYHLNENGLKLGFGSKLPLAAASFTSAHHLSGSFVTTNNAEYSNSSDSKSLIFDKSDCMTFSVNESDALNITGHFNNSDPKSDILIATINESNESNCSNNSDSKTIILDDSEYFNLFSHLSQQKGESCETENVISSGVNVKLKYDKTATNYPNNKKALSREMNFAQLLKVRDDTVENIDEAISKNEPNIRELIEPPENSVLEIDSYQNKVDILNRSLQIENLLGLEMCKKFSNNRENEMFWSQDFTLLGFEDAKNEPLSLLEKLSTAKYQSTRDLNIINNADSDKFLKCDQEIEKNLRKIWIDNHGIIKTKGLLRSDCELSKENFSVRELNKNCIKNSNETKSIGYELANSFDTYRCLCQKTIFSNYSDGLNFDSKAKDDDCIKFITDGCDKDEKQQCHRSLYGYTIDNKDINNNKLQYTDFSLNNSPKDVTINDIIAATYDFEDENFASENTSDVSNTSIHFKNSKSDDFFITERLTLNTVLGLNQRHASYFTSSPVEDDYTLNKLNFSPENKPDNSVFSDENILQTDAYAYSMPEFEDLNEEPSFDTEWHLTDSVFPEINIDDTNLNKTYDAQKHLIDMNHLKVSNENIITDFIYFDKSNKNINVKKTIYRQRHSTSN